MVCCGVLFEMVVNVVEMSKAKKLVNKVGCN